jgi:hypothetical protein
VLAFVAISVAREGGWAFACMLRCVLASCCPCSSNLLSVFAMQLMRFGEGVSLTRSFCGKKKSRRKTMVGLLRKDGGAALLFRHRDTRGCTLSDGVSLYHLPSSGVAVILWRDAGSGAASD